MAKDRRSSEQGRSVRLTWGWAEAAGVIVALASPLLILALSARGAHFAAAAYGAGTVFVLVIWLRSLARSHQSSARSRRLKAQDRELASEKRALEHRHLIATNELMQDRLAHENEVGRRVQQLERAKNDFVSSVSHELRSPLTSTLGYLELLADGDAGELQPEQSRMIEIASRNARRLQALIEDLLMLSRIESGSFRLRFQPVNISVATRAAVERSAKAAKERNINLLVAMADRAGVCPGEETQLIQAIDNVIANAVVKFTPAGGNVNVTLEPQGSDVVITVQDTGAGIPAEEQSMLFDRFFRASIAVDQAHHGTGLGLTIAKAIIEHHGGSISLSSVEGDGTTVKITLPSIPMNSKADLTTQS